MIRAWERWFFEPVSLSRGTLLARGVLLVLGLDCVHELAGHGARYGVLGFNVAHFRWLDAVQPTPTPALYVGVVLLAGAGALVAAVIPGAVPRGLLATVAALYTWGWAMSMLDSYQHHYLISLLLVILVCVPQPPAEGRRALGTSWAWVLFCVTMAVVYAYTARVKIEEPWLAGDVLRRVADGAGMAADGEGATGVGRRAQELLVGLEADARRAGGEAAVDRLWRRLGSSVFPLQVLLALAYLVAPLRDRRLGRAGRVAVAVVTGAALPAALAFHWAADAVLELRIGWFGAYMMLAALVAFLPGPWLDRVVAAGRGVVARVHGSDVASPVALGAVIIGGAALGFALGTADLPGSEVAGTVVAVGAVGAGLLARRRGGGAAPLAGAIGTSLAAVVLVLVLSLGEVRYVYWRYAGGDAYRRGDWTAAAVAYEKALRYAPADERGTPGYERRRRKMERARRAAGGAP